MYIAGVMPTGLALPIVQLIVQLGERVQSFLNLFAEEGAEDDEKEKDDTIVDDLDDDEDDSLFGKEEKEEDDKEGDEDKSKDKPKKDSAIVQKQKYRELYKKTSKELEDFKNKLAEKDKSGTEADPAKAKAEKEARDYLRGLINELLGERESKDEREQRELDEQMEELLEDNDDLTEKQIVEVVEELGVTPKQAVAAIRREQKANGTGKKAKPFVPRSKRGGESTADDEKKKSDKPMTLEQASEQAKKKLREMQSRN